VTFNRKMKTIWDQLGNRL